MAKSTDWTRDQLLMALRLYMRTPFGRLHRTNPDIVALAAKIGRTPSALAMKASNFASIDPNLKQKGLANASRADEAIWREFETNPTALAVEAELAAGRFGEKPMPSDDPIIPIGPTERTSTVCVRLVQSFFRSAVMISYEGRCAITGLDIPELLTASHIIPWSESIERRADPTNGLILNALLDRAYDRGFIAIDDAYRVVVAKGFTERVEKADLDSSLLAIEGRTLTMPKRFRPDPVALAHHREKVFRG